MNALAYAGFAVGLPVVLIVPGWLWLRRAGLEPLMALYLGLGATVLAANAIVALGVVLPWGVPTTCSAGLGLIAVTAVWCGWTAPRPLLPERKALTGVAAFIVAFGAMAAFNGVPSNPEANWGVGTLGPQRVETPRWPGQLIDNTLPYRTGQVALHKLGGEQTRDKYSVGWWISDRTPLTGLAFTFTAGAVGVNVPTDDPTLRPTAEVRMTVKDDYGFWAYQLTAMFLNLAVILGVFLLAWVWRGPQVAMTAGILAALVPGFFLNGIFTWPKQAIGYFVLAGAAAALQRRVVLAGAAGALGYLVHPAGVFWIPALAVLLLSNRELREKTRSTLLRFAAPVAVLTAPWIFFTSQIMHASSRWTTSPLSYVMTDPTDFWGELSDGWDGFTDLGLVHAIWVRIASTAGSTFPLDTGVTLAAPANDPTNFDVSASFLWTNSHGFAVWGMIGLVLFLPAIVSLVRRWEESRRIVLCLVLPALILAELANGFVYPFANQSMFPLVGILVIQAAVALRALRPAAQVFVVGCVAFELLSIVYIALYEPFNVGEGVKISFTLGAAALHVLLVLALLRTLDLVPRWRFLGRLATPPGASHPART